MRAPDKADSVFVRFSQKSDRDIGLAFLKMGGQIHICFGAFSSLGRYPNITN